MYYRPTLIFVLRYAITDGGQPVETVEARRERILSGAKRWSTQNVAYVQLREKSLQAGELLRLAEAMVHTFQGAGGITKLLVSGRADIAVAAGADGVHLTSNPDELTPEQMRRVFALAGRESPIVSVSCHTALDVERASGQGADLLLFGPVFEKRVNGVRTAPGVGLGLLAEACRTAQGVPVFALGGVTEANALQCLEAGAAGITGIRLAQEL